MTTLEHQPKTPSVAGYRLGRLLGRGGMADVYASVDERDGTPVAVKVFRETDLSDPGHRGAEVRTLTALRHPNLVELLEAGSHGGRDFLVMTLVEGPTLGAACHQQRLPLPRTAHIGAAVADALAYVHAGGVVHRDVKPDNVLLGPGPRVRLTDFGIARMVTDTRITRTGIAVGTAGYMAPEQVTGAHIDTPADIYALGLVLLECLTGHREYQGPGIEAARARLHRRPQLPTRLPAGWTALLEAMTASDPAARPSAGAVALALHLLSASPHASVTALKHSAGAPLTPARVTGAAADARPNRPAAPCGSTHAHGRRHRRRLLSLAAAATVALTTTGIAGEQLLLWGGAPAVRVTATTSALTDVRGMGDLRAADTALRRRELAQAQQDTADLPAALPKDNGGSRTGTTAATGTARAASTPARRQRRRRRRAASLQRCQRNRWHWCRQHQQADGSRYQLGSHRLLPLRPGSRQFSCGIEWFR